ncbi:hypothetical protein B2J93_6722 [Marssonina coronariae]|uniref:Uncharacterized protein n=1 Tax=Diplocarpon coronariae TaxID=2795749 RepID=A0A218ZHB7_9HELO|nr:hypothetical protein B2J93_6722 [Marssonina coronariae]
MADGQMTIDVGRRPYNDPKGGAAGRRGTCPPRINRGPSVGSRGRRGGFAAARCLAVSAPRRRGWPDARRPTPFPPRRSSSRRPGGPLGTAAAAETGRGGGECHPSVGLGLDRGMPFSGWLAATRSCPGGSRKQKQKQKQKQEAKTRCQHNPIESAQALRRAVLPVILISVPGHSRPASPDLHAPHGRPGSPSDGGGRRSPRPTPNVSPVPVPPAIAAARRPLWAGWRRQAVRALLRGWQALAGAAPARAQGGRVSVELFRPRPPAAGPEWPGRA